MISSIDLIKGQAKCLWFFFILFACVQILGYFITGSQLFKIFCIVWLGFSVIFYLINLYFLFQFHGTTRFYINLLSSHKEINNCLSSAFTIALFLTIFVFWTQSLLFKPTLYNLHFVLSKDLWYGSGADDALSYYLRLTYRIMSYERLLVPLLIATMVTFTFSYFVKFEPKQEMSESIEDELLKTEDGSLFSGEVRGTIRTNKEQQ